MNRIVLLMLTLLVTAGCSQSENTGSAAPVSENQPAAAQAAAVAENVPAAETPSVAEPAAGRIELAQVDMSAVEAAGFVAGQSYTLISPVQPTSTAPGRIEVNYFLLE